MTKPAGTLTDVNDDTASSWGTWEELLLAFAVNRHGAGAWESIAGELQKRRSDSSLALTAQNCQVKYIDLRRRFVSQNDDLSDAVKSMDDESVPLLEELRKLRVAELRREVERYDLNIESLELKMKRMEEETEKNVSDLEKKSEPELEPANGGESVPGEDSEKDQLSMNESHSTDPLAEMMRTGEKEHEPVRTGGVMEKPNGLMTEPDTKPIRGPEDSCNGSSSSIEKEPGREAKVAVVSDSAELVESEAESKGGGEEAKENSDVQSTASISMEGSDKVRCGIMSGDERDHEDQSRAVKELSAKSQRLIDFLQLIRSHKFGSVFERRLRSQESSKYQKLILQHVDLETIETRLKEGWYSKNTSKFYRDLLLLVNNALVFFNKNSSEAKASTEVRKLISKEMSQKSAKSNSSFGKQVSLQSLTKKEDPSQSLLLKPALSGSIIVCRKRSSIAAKASGSDKKKDLTPLPDDDKDIEEPKITKKRTRDGFAPVLANSKKIGKSQAKSNKNPVVEKVENQQGKGGQSSKNNNNQSTTDSKKRGAANFLNRMKQGSSSSKNSSLLDALKNTPLTSESGKGGSESKKNENVKRGVKKEEVSKRVTETRQVKEKGSPEKKNVGRPSKRGAATPPRPVVGKRGRGGEGESSGSKQAKKRSRKL